MHSLVLDVVQYDCPFVDTSAAHPVTFRGATWTFDTARERLETRVLAEAADPESLDAALAALRDHDHTEGYRLVSRRGDTAMVRTAADQTAAMATVRDHDGSLTGAFEAHDGRERWRVGFDDAARADAALSELDRDNEYRVAARESLDPRVVADVLRNAPAAGALLSGCRDLTQTERETLCRAHEMGVFESPRGATVGDLAASFDVSTAAASATLRRAHRKTVGGVRSAFETLD